MKTKNILVSAFILIALNANSFATTQSDDSLNIIAAQHVSMVTPENLESSTLSRFVAGRNKNNTNNLETIKNFELLKTSTSKMTQHVGFSVITKSIAKGRNKLITGL